MSRTILLFFLCLFAALQLNASDIWVTQSGANGGGYDTSSPFIPGTNSGASLDQAWAWAYLSAEETGNALHWPGSSSSGNHGNVLMSTNATIRVWGLITNQLTLPSFFSSKTITIQFETNCVFGTNGFWPSTEGYVIKAQNSPCNLLLTQLHQNMIINWTNNGQGLQHTNTPIFLFVQNSSNVWARGLVISNYCLRLGLNTATGTNTDMAEDTACFSFTGFIRNSGVSNCVIDMCATPIGVGYSGSCSNFCAVSNVLYRNSIPINFGSTPSIFTEMSDAQVLWNYCDYQAPFDDGPSSTGHHQNGILHEFSQGTLNSFMSNAVAFSPPLNFLGAYNGAYVVQSNYDAAGYCRIANIPIPVDHWWAGTNDEYIQCAQFGATNSGFLASTNVYSFSLVTNYLVLHGRTNSPLTCILYDVYIGTNRNMHIAYNTFGGHGSTNGSAVGVFVGDEHPGTFVNSNIHDNLILQADNNCGYTSGFINGGGINCAVFNNTIINQTTKTAGGGVKWLNGSGTCIFNNLTTNLISVVDFTGVSKSQTIGASDYNAWGGISYWFDGQPTTLWTNLFYNSSLYCFYSMTNGAFEFHSTTNRPALNANYSPSNTNNTGTNLTAFAANRNLFNLTDILGTLRTGSGVWTPGAFEVNTNYAPPAVAAGIKFVFIRKL